MPFINYLLNYLQNWLRTEYFATEWGDLSPLSPFPYVTALTPFI